MTQERPARDQASCRCAAARAELYCVTAAARSRLEADVAGLSCGVTDTRGRIGRWRHVGGCCCPGAHKRCRKAGDHSRLPAAVTKTNVTQDIAAHESVPPGVPSWFRATGL